MSRPSRAASTRRRGAEADAESASRGSKAQLAAEARALARLDEAGSRLWQAQSMREGLDAMLSATIDLLSADMGMIQIFDARREVLQMVAQRGLKEDFLELFREVCAEDETACARALRTGEPVVIEDVELDRSFAPFRSAARSAGFRAVVSAPLIDRRGRPLGVFSAHFRSPRRPSDADLKRLALYRQRAADFIERSRFEQALIESEERHRLAVEAGQMGTWDWNAATDVATWDDQLFRLLGYEVGEVEPHYAAWAERVHPDDRASAEAALDSAMREHRDYAYTYRLLLPDGSVRWCSGRGRPVYDAEGEPVRMLGLLEDVTERKQWEESQKVLVAELQHRTRNLLTVVQSIAHQTLKSARSLDGFQNDFNLRLSALSRVQSLLSRADNDPITVGALVALELEALRPDATEDRISLEGPAVALRRSAVQLLALAIHELATNALKHGALASESGRLSVTWRVEGARPNQRLVLEWVERGIAPAPPAADPARRGYGRTLIERALPYSLSAQTKFDLGADALRCVIDLPLSTSGVEEAVG